MHVRMIDFHGGTEGIALGTDSRHAPDLYLEVLIGGYASVRENTKLSFHLQIPKSGGHYECLNQVFSRTLLLRSA